MPSASRRLISLDALRGLDVLVMLFVNDVASVRGLPAWLYHTPPHRSGLTMVDVVFPAFLFMVGTAIPLAIDRRRGAGASAGRLAWHVVLRSLSLVLIGILVMNGRELDPAASHVPYGLWNAAMLVAVVLAWADDPRAEGRRRRVLAMLRWTSIAVLVVLAAVFRSKRGGGWFDLSDWSILGSIGWSYGIATLVYLGVRGRRGPIALALAALVLWNVASRVWLPISWTSRHLPPLGNGGAASIVIAGILATLLLGGNAGGGTRRLLLYATVLAIAGFAFVPSFGIAKIGATPAWCLLCSAITAALLAVFYLAIDVKGWTGLGRPFVDTGRNALAVYLLPDVFYAVFGVTWLDAQLGYGLPGAARSAAFAVAWVAVGTVLTRMRIRMQL